MILGRWESEGATANESPAEEVRGVALEMLEEGAQVTKISALLDGEGAGSGEQEIVAAVWDGPGTLLGVSEIVRVPNGADLDWYDFRFEEAVPVGAENFVIGLIFGSPTDVARWYGHPGDLTGFKAEGMGIEGEDIGASFSGPAPLMFATYTIPIPLPDEDDNWFARLGFNSAQTVLGGTGPDRSTRTNATAGWHGTWLDVEPQGASFAIVDREGALADWVGNRIRITHGQNVAYAYVHRSTDLDDDGVDLSLSRRVFAALDLLSAENIAVKVEQMA